MYVDWFGHILMETVDVYIFREGIYASALTLVVVKSLYIAGTSSLFYSYIAFSSTVLPPEARKAIRSRS